VNVININAIKDTRIKILLAPEISFDKVLNTWNKNKDHENYECATTKIFQYMKFFVMDQYFKKWDYVFYIDSGAKILKSLNRFKINCKPENCFYAHSDAYPIYEWKLKRQFCLDIDDNISLKLLDRYKNLDCDYFQTTIFIYDTKILNENYVQKMIELMNLYPISYRNDQGIFNLFILCEKNLWKQIPTKDNQGFLYDFMVRPEYSIDDYAIIKY